MLVQNAKVNLRIWKKKRDQTYCVPSPKPLPQIYKHIPRSKTRRNRTVHLIPNRNSRLGRRHSLQYGTLTSVFTKKYYFKWWKYYKSWKYLLSYYLANKRSLHIRSQDLEILTLIEKNRKIKITHHCHYNKN